MVSSWPISLALGTEHISKASIDELLISLDSPQKPQTRSQSKNDRPLFRASTSKTFEVTPIPSLIIENMDAEQVWMQLDLRVRAICDLSDCVLGTKESKGETFHRVIRGDEEDDLLLKVMEAIENGEEIDFDALEEEYGEEDVEDTADNESEDESDDFTNEDEDVIHLQSSDEDLSDLTAKGNLLDVVKSDARSNKNGSVHGLNDDFFDLDVFHAETYQAEAKSSSLGQLTSPDVDLTEHTDISEGEDENVDLFASFDDEAETRDAAGMYQPIA